MPVFEARPSGRAPSLAANNLRANALSPTLRTVSLAQWSLRVAILAALLCLGWVFAKRQGFGSDSPRLHTAAASSGPDRLNQADGVKILQFYPRDSVLTGGGKTVLCYGVSNARSVRIDPPVDGVGPALSRCVEVRPKRETLYTLIAEGADGRLASQSASVRIASDPAILPKITSFRIAGCVKDYEGKPVFSLSFADQNAEVVSIDPPVFAPLHGSTYGQFGVRPEKTTTYTLSVAGKFGHVVRKQLTVDIAACK